MNMNKKKKMEEFYYEELRAATGGFSDDRLIGKGSQGLIYKGIILKNNKKLVVAIKKPIHDNSKLENEICILSSLPENPFCISLLGLSHDSAMNKRFLVMEYMPNGSLYDLLHGSTSTSTESPPSWPKRLQMATQIALAVKFLHEYPDDNSIVHRDIKSANILFDANWNAKLADFGLAVRLLQHDDNNRDFRVESPSQPAGTMGYLDPCYTSPCKLSTKNDVFSFGVVLLEIISGKRAIDVLRVPSSIVDWAMVLIENDQTMEICDTSIPLPTYVKNTIQNVLNIVKRCVSLDEKKRPSIDEVVMDMGNCLLVVQRVRFFPFWMSLLRWWRSKAKVRDDVHGELCTSNGKMSLREVLVLDRVIRCNSIE